MMQSWQNFTLGELADSGQLMLQTGPFGSQLHKHDYCRAGVPVIPTEAIGHRRLRTDGVPQILPEKADELHRHRLAPGDILFARRGVQATGYSAIVEPQHAGWICGTGAILLRILTSGIDPTFLSFFLASTSSIAWLKQHAVGAVMPNLNEGVLRRFPIALPDLPEQRRIADILGSLDDKIELNRRINETLEALARRLFKSWFVDFDPVLAKAALRREHPKLSNLELSRRALPNMAPEIAELFPDSFEDSTLGPIPKGWKVDEIGNAVKVLGGGTPSTSVESYWQDGVHCFCTPKDMSGLTASVLLDTERHLTDQGVSKISSGQLPQGALLLSSRAPIGYLAIAEVPVSINQGIIAMVCDGPVSQHYALQWARTNMEAIEANANGSTFMEISKKNFRSLPILIPSTDIVLPFDRIAGDYHLQIKCNLVELQSLTRTRDRLLPQLLSGSIDLGAA